MDIFDSSLCKSLCNKFGSCIFFFFHLTFYKFFLGGWGGGATNNIIGWFFFPRLNNEYELLIAWCDKYLIGRLFTHPYMSIFIYRYT
jgi:hypothetical protein